MTREFFDLEYLQAGKTLQDLEAETGFPVKLLAATAREHGITLTRASAPAPIGGDWLREQYQARHRSYTGIAAELGVRPETVIAAARRHHIPSRPFTVHSRPEMTTRLEAAVPRDIRRAVEGSLQGWHRLRRFQAAMAFPTIEAAAAHLGTSQSALIHQLRRLERDIGAPLYHASSPGKPMQPTRRGTALLAALDRPDIHALAMEHAPDMSGPASSRNPGHEPAAPGPAAATAQQAAPLFRALAEPTRLAILLTLQDGEQRITDLAAQLGATQTAVSSHITVLKDRGLITGRPRAARSITASPGRMTSPRCSAPLSSCSPQPGSLPRRGNNGSREIGWATQPSGRPRQPKGPWWRVVGPYARPASFVGTPSGSSQVVASKARTS